MANQKQAAAKRLNMSERSKQQFELHFGDTPEPLRWHRKTNDGYTTLPRTLPIVMQAVDKACKGQPPGHTLFCLWSRAPDNSVLMIENPATFAAEAGFTGERSVDTWRKRMKKLREYNLIRTKPGASGEFYYVLLVNPNAALEGMRAKGEINDELYGRFIDRLAEIGALNEIYDLREYWKECQSVEQDQGAAGPLSGKSSTEFKG